MAVSLARRLWQGVEPVHCVVYFAPETADAYRDIGLKGYWMGYFGSRAAALGAASASLVEAIFYNFAGRMVQRSIPDAWGFASPQRILEARHAIADAVLPRLLADVDVDEVSALASRLAAALPVEGRALSAAHAALPWPRSPHMRLWHAATLLREFRADGHFATLLTNGIDGCEALVMQVAAGAPREALQPFRGWTDEEWAGAESRLQARGVVGADGTLTAAGQALRTRIEETTDALALPSPSPLGDVEMERLVAQLQDIRRIVDEATMIPYPNPMVLARASGAWEPSKP